MKFRITEYVNGAGKRYWELKLCSWNPLAWKYIGEGGYTYGHHNCGRHASRDEVLLAIDKYIQRKIDSKITKVKVEYVVR